MGRSGFGRGLRSNLMRSTRTGITPVSRGRGKDPNSGATFTQRITAPGLSGPKKTAFDKNVFDTKGEDLP